jgi:hypothetical protein
VNLCQKHWDELKQAIKDRGLFHLVPSTMEEAAQNAVASLEGQEGRFDPLMGASNTIFKNAFHAIGLPLLEPGDSGKPPCPICFLLQECPCKKGADCDINNWIKYAADGALDYAREQKLVGGGQA